MENTREVRVSDLKQIADTIRIAIDHHQARDEMNAKLHLASTRYSPLTTELSGAWNLVIHLINSK